MPLTTLTATIPAGQSLSGAINATSGTVLMITIPSNWTPANLSWQASSDGNTYYDVVDEYGKELMNTAMAGTCVIVGNDALWKGMNLKIRSGSRDHPVNQINLVQFTIAVQS